MIDYGQKESYWIRITNNKSFDVDDGDGKWVVFLSYEHFKKKYSSEKLYLSKIDDFINKYDLKGAIVPKKFFDELIIFTSADRIEIHRVKELILNEFSVESGNLIWKAIFETENDWDHEKGKRNILNSLLTSYQNRENLIKNKRYDKADRVWEKDIRPKINLINRILLEADVENRKSMVITPSFTSIDYEIDPNMIFVIMPYNENFSEDIFHLIKNAGEKTDFDVIRADDIFAPDIIINDVWKYLNKASLIVADITVHNANVFYELGISHTLGKKVILLKKADGEKAPFDISFWRYFEYETGAKKADEFKITLETLFTKHRDEITA